jgi:hypothetical protein
MNSNEASDRPTGSTLGPSDHPCSSTATHPTLLNNGPSVHPTVPRVWPCAPTRPTIAPTLVFEGPSVHPTVSFSFLFLARFWPLKIDYRLNLAYGFLASLGPRSVYKDMLNNMVSPNDHVVMNHQNQTRTNGIWGHVRYKIKLFSCKNFMHERDLFAGGTV